MKGIFLFLFGILKLTAKGQVNDCGDSAYLWNLEKNNLYLEIIYYAPNKDSIELLDILYTIVNSKTGVKNVRKENSDIYFNIDDQMIDIKKYGYRLMSSWFGVLNPVSYNGRITCKNGKYRLLISGLTTKQQAGIYSNEITWYWNKDIFYKSGCLRGKTMYNALTVTRLFMYDEFIANTTSKKLPSDF